MTKYTKKMNIAYKFESRCDMCEIGCDIRGESPIFDFIILTTPRLLEVARRTSKGLCLDCASSVHRMVFQREIGVSLRKNTPSVFSFLEKLQMRTHEIVTSREKFSSFAREYFRHSRYGIRSFVEINTLKFALFTKKGARDCVATEWVMYYENCLRKIHNIPKDCLAFWDDDFNIIRFARYTQIEHII